MIRLIAAIDLKRGLAKNGKIPWKLPSDGKRFQDLTLSHGANVLMGRKTYEQMGGNYLAERTNYIVSHQSISVSGNSKLVNNLDDFLTSFKEDLWVIGGSDIYDLTINKASELYLTIVHGDFACDRFFPDYSNFNLKKNDGPYNENDLTYYYQLWTAAH